MRSDSIIAKASLVLTATLAISAVPEKFTPNPASADALTRIENIRAALVDGSHKVLMRQGQDSDYVVTQFAQNFSNSFNQCKPSSGNTC